MEIEVKVKIDDPAGCRRRLMGLGFREVTPRLFEDNWIFDDPEDSLQRKRLLLRLRLYGGRFVLTFKGPAAETGGHKVREEIEMEISAGDAFREILHHLSLREVFRYQKWRTVFEGTGDSAGHALIDETPIGAFLELEGEGEWIDRTAKALSFSPHEFILKSYAVLYLEHCARLGIKSQAMVFDSSLIGNSQ